MVDGTRIGVHDVVSLIVNGSSVDDVVRSFPDLTRAQVYDCLAYYEDHRPEIDSLVARQMSTELRGSFSTMTYPSKSPGCYVTKAMGLPNFGRF